jgi:predicted site-specific integrase-resolvase
MKIALYARVSTSDKGQDPEMQLTEAGMVQEAREAMAEKAATNGMI